MADPGPGPGSVQGDAAAIDALAKMLSAAAADLSGVASGAERGIPPVPEDEHGVGLGFVALDEARERLDRRSAELFEVVGTYLQQLAEVVATADQAAAAAFSSLPSGQG